MMPPLVPVGPDYGFSLYVHWPYCTRICPYCDFNVYAAKNRETGPLVDAMCADLRSQRARLPAHPPLHSIFFGGGTPSLLPAAAMARIIGEAEALFGLDASCEISLEANPNDVSAASLRAWSAAGVNRVSLGIQALCDTALTFLGRDHDAKTARQAAEAVAKVFDNFSLDLIYARPGQSLSDWRSELSEVLSLQPPHLSLYELTIASATPFGRQVSRGEWAPADDERQADLYELTQKLCQEAGLPAYEVSNHARTPAFRSVHNQIYWSSGDWIGVGPGAHGRLSLAQGRVATTTHRRPADYIRAPKGEDTPLSDLDVARELVVMALRSSQGLELQRLRALHADIANPGLASEWNEQGLLELTARKLTLTQTGWLLADHISAHLSP